MSNESKPREQLATRLGFILLSAACAIGIGNVWRFPYIAGKNGGGAFVAIYLVALAIVGLPILMMEFACGRAAQKSIAKLHGVLTPDKKAWSIHGVLGIMGNVCLMMFYTTVTAWMIISLVTSATGGFSKFTPEEISSMKYFVGMITDPVNQIIAMFGVSLGCVAVCAIGLQKGLERVNKWMMLCLLGLIIVLAVHSLTLDGAMEGVKFYLIPSLKNMQEVGVVQVIKEAMNHAFFTLSLGIGSMAIFGSYIKKEHSLVKESINVCVLDTFVALCAGFIIIPACFAFHAQPGGGPGLVFATLPNVFNQMAGGKFWGTLFFLFMSFAALSTVLAVFENIIAGLMDFTGWSRLKACGVLAVVIPLASLPCIFGFNMWSSFQPLGAGTCVMDLEDFVVSDCLLPLGGLTFCIYSCHKIGWGWDNFVKEANQGSGMNVPTWIRPYCKWVLPLIIFGIFAIGLWDKYIVKLCSFGTLMTIIGIAALVIMEFVTFVLAIKIWNKIKNN